MMYLILGWRPGQRPTIEAIDDNTSYYLWESSKAAWREADRLQDEEDRGAHALLERYGIDRRANASYTVHAVSETPTERPTHWSVCSAHRERDPDCPRCNVAKANP